MYAEVHSLRDNQLSTELLNTPVQEGGVEQLKSGRCSEHHMKSASLKSFQNDVDNIPMLGTATVVDKCIVGVIDCQKSTALPSQRTSQLLCQDSAGLKFPETDPQAG